MSRHALADAEECLRGDLALELDQPAAGLRRERIGNLRVSPRGGIDGVRTKTKQPACGERLQIERRSAGEQRADPRELAAAQVAHGNLTAVGRSHVGADEASEQQDGEGPIALAVQVLPGGGFRDPGARAETVERVRRQGERQAAAEHGENLG